jgi:hypothetical protein
MRGKRSGRFDMQLLYTTDVFIYSCEIKERTGEE